MEKIEAKAVIDGEYWILRQNKIKIGQVTCEPAGYTVRIHGQPAGTYKDINELKDSDMFKFVEIRNEKEKPVSEVHGYPSDGVAYNPMWNLRYNLPLYTQTPDSKSWYAAGYYHVMTKGRQSIEFCPKLITLQRNTFKGPYKEAPTLLNSELFEEAK